MALSLDSIFEPVNDFFINKFKVDEGSPVFFRFAKVGSVISDEYFIEPETRQEKSTAQETLSDLINGLPFEEPDGVNISFGASLIDSEYNRLLSAAIPFVSPSDPDSEAITNSFVEAKSDANRAWERYSLPRGRGIADYYRASFATPANWYDRNNNQIWTLQSLQIKESVTPLADNDPKRQLWKLRLDDDHLKAILPALGTATIIQPVDLHESMLLGRPAFGFLKIPQEGIVRDHRRGPVVRDHRREPVVRDHRREPVVRDHRRGPVVRDHRRGPGTDFVSPASQNLRAGLRGLDLKKRLAVLQWVRENAPTQPSSSSSLKIEFEYCGVNIRRPWLTDTFIKNKSWYMPGSARGEESAPGPEMNLSALPIGFIAIKNLSITGDWSQVDIDASKNATDFGPFEVRTEIVSKRLSHEGIQIVGWFLQRMPDLPPKDPPG